MQTDQHFLFYIATIVCQKNIYIFANKGCKMHMDIIQDINTAQSYLEGMLRAAFGVKIIDCNVAEWQIDAAKECAKKLDSEG